MVRLIVFFLTILVAASASAADITVSGAWIRRTPGGAPAGGYFTVHSKKATALVGARTPDYGMVTMHRTVEQGGIAKMIPVSRIDLSAGGTVVFQPGGYHLMLMHAGHDVALGSKIPVTLLFSDRQNVTVPFEVRGPTAR
ncbi:MAG: hypothetical protein A3G25_10600 [Betaproteobacteria bacterium RIFCSPLOWO2_12_FULL_63_13]|nr:MAG: hypothetical protein A3H32_04520 [Betaproteobacteria bacterium RIFCSPLOWO2_02_FULL_63_19]OGA43244.1 MAG: hypothetical protein A3G25_10600 [Betaproteobacteria bacterium RIFCSPLOWO2_12_FULL_63_13]